MKFLVLTLLLAGCGWFGKNKNEPAETTTTPVPADVTALHQKFLDKRTALVAASDQETGWPSVADCDGTLWAGIARTFTPVKLELAEYSPGSIHRRPEKSGECYPTESGSTVSNDMLLGYSLGMWAAKDLPALQRLADYGEQHNWTMGDGDTARTVFRPNGYSLVGRMVFVLSGGTDARSYRSIPPLYLPVLADYEKHLLVEGIELNGAVNEALRKSGLALGAITLLDVNDQQLARLKELSESEPTDALVQAV